MTDQTQMPEQQPEAKPAKRKRVRKTVAQWKAEIERREQDAYERGMLNQLDNMVSDISCLLKNAHASIGPEMDGFRDELLAHDREQMMRGYLMALVDLDMPPFLHDEVGNAGIYMAKAIVRVYLKTLEMSKAAGESSLSQPASTPSHQPLATLDGLTIPERDLVQAGKMIEAIKMLRNRTGLGLKECKDLVDAYHAKL